MSYDCYITQPERCCRPVESCVKNCNYESLVFNAANINDGTETTPDTIPVGTADSALQILGWRLSPLATGETPEEYSLTFNVPADAFNGCQRAKVFVHLLTDNSAGIPGSTFSIRLTSLFARENGVVSIANRKVLVQSNIAIQNSPGNYQYNHYVLEFTLCDTIRCEDFALLSVARIGSTDDFQGDIVLTSIEFRYLSC